MRLRWVYLLPVAAIGFTWFVTTPATTEPYTPPTPGPMGITAALLAQQRGVLLVDARTPHADNLPIPGAVRTGASSPFSNSSALRSIIVIGDDTHIAPLKARYGTAFGGWVPASTLGRQTALASPDEITPRELWARRAKFQIVDLREGEEYETSRIADSRNVSVLDTEREIPRDRPVALFCLTGHRSAYAVQKLKALGWKNVVSVRGGWLDWKTQNLPLDSQKGGV
jgi:rhodanese-related sulfurtransferase